MVPRVFTIRRPFCPSLHLHWAGVSGSVATAPEGSWYSDRINTHSVSAKIINKQLRESSGSDERRGRFPAKRWCSNMCLEVIKHRSRSHGGDRPDDPSPQVFISMLTLLTLCESKVRAKLSKWSEKSTLSSAVCPSLSSAAGKHWQEILNPEISISCPRPAVTAYTGCFELASHQTGKHF